MCFAPAEGEEAGTPGFVIVMYFLPAQSRFRAIAHGRSLPQVSPSAVFVLSMAGGRIGSRGRIPRERNPCLAERAKEPGWTLPLPAVPREGTARLHAAEEDSRRFQPTTIPTVILACRRAVAHFLVAIAEAGAPVRVPPAIDEDMEDVDLAAVAAHVQPTQASWSQQRVLACPPRQAPDV